MKIVFSAWVLCIFAASSLWSQVPSVKAIERSRGPHHKVWNAIHQRVAPNGVTYARTNTYVELATGLHHWKNNQWEETQEAIRIQEGSAVADEGPHKVSFAANLNSVGAIDMETPDGKRFRSHVLGLAYTDSVTGATVMIAEVKDSIGGVLDPNQVIYQDAFEGDVVQNQF